MSQSYCDESGKVRHATKADATKALKAIQHRPGHKKVGAGVYPCDACGGFHISKSVGFVQHMRKAERRRRA